MNKERESVEVMFPTRALAKNAPVKLATTIPIIYIRYTFGYDEYLPLEPRVFWLLANRVTIRVANTHSKKKNMKDVQNLKLSSPMNVRIIAEKKTATISVRRLNSHDSDFALKYSPRTNL
jgi:hypothetical protein